MKQIIETLLLLLVIQSSALADFSRSKIDLHPQFPGADPFIIEVSGTWPSDCHPGEQKPVVETFDGHTVVIEFEIIIVHVTCNFSDTQYRALIDMSEVVRTSTARSDTLDVRISFQGESSEWTVDLFCTDDGNCASETGNQKFADVGLYQAPSLANQGLLLARQNAATTIFPLVYDEAGTSEWLFTGNLMVEDSFFAEILRASGGDCFGCMPSDAKPDLTAIGYLSVLADRPGVLQVKINDGLFVEYESLVYGYQTFPVGAASEQILIDLEGRWGISENRGSNPSLGDLTEFFPGVFDLELEDIVTADAGIQRSGQVSYLLNTPTGQTLGQLVCKGQTSPDNSSAVCEFIDPTDAAEPLFLFYQQGPARLAIEYGREVMATGTPPGGQAVRLN